MPTASAKNVLAFVLSIMIAISRAAFMATMAISAVGLRKAGKRRHNVQNRDSPKAQVVPAIGDALQSDPSAQSCTCSIGMYAWQQWPLSHEGYGCVGGCGGEEFSINNYDGIVKHIMAWFWRGDSNDFIKAMQVEYEDGYTERVGIPTGSPWYWTFNPGEWIVGDLRISYNGHDGGRLGSIGFTTNLGRTWNCGRRGHEYYFPTGGTMSRATHIAGLAGAKGHDIDRLGVIFWKPIIDTQYISITYPTLDSLPRLSSPTDVRSRSFCNNGPFPLPATERTLEEVVTVGVTSCFTASLETTLSVGLTVSAGIPFIQEGEATAEWSITAALGTELCRNAQETKKETLKFPSFDIPPYTSIRQTFSQWAGSLGNLPYSAVLRVTMADGTIADRVVEGFYSGIQYNDVHLKYNTITNVTSC